MSNNAKALKTVKAAGKEAYNAGKPWTACPYNRVSRGNNNWKCVWWVWWMKGWEEAKLESKIARGLS